MLTKIKNRFNKMIDEIDTSSAISIISSIIVVLTFLFTIVKGQFEKVTLKDCISTISHFRYQFLPHYFRYQFLL